jgi:stearoyl-CoA desaturase (Delta-9 desaturase)
VTQMLERPAPTEPMAFASPRQRLERNLVVVFSVVPFLALGIAIPLLWQRGISGVDLGIMLGFYIFTGLGITVGFHRLFTHRSFEAHPVIRTAFAVAGSMAIEGPIIGWVADHRRHHQFSDQPGDPHSPHLGETGGWRGALKGLWHAHMGWLLLAEKTVEERFAPDMLKDRTMVWIDRWFAGFVTLSLLLPALIGYAITGTPWGAFTAFLWGSLVRVMVLHHVTYSINSICHFFGTQPYESKDESRNNWLLALPSFGEAWHNNHHAFPSSAVHGIDRGQVDPGAWVIHGLEKVGLAQSVKVPGEKLRSRKRSG